MRAGRRALLAAVMLALALAGCATAYQPEGATGGYTDKKLADDTYRVSFNGNGYTSRQAVEKYFLYRCAELTLKHGYAYFQVFSAKQVSLAPPVEQGRFVRTAYVPSVTYVPDGAVERWIVTGVIRMFPKDIMVVGDDMFDARDVVKTLGAEVRSGNPSSHIPHKYRRIEGKFPVMPRAAVNGRESSATPSAPRSGSVNLDDLRGLMKK